MDFNIHNLIKIHVDGTQKRTLNYFCRDYFHFTTVEPTEPDIEVIISDFVPDIDNCYLVNHKYYIKDDSIFCKDTHKVVKWKVYIKALSEKKTIVYFSGTKFSEVFLRDCIIEPIIALKLALKGFVFLHASGIAMHGKGFVFPACKGVGKTSTLLNLAGQGVFLGNDKVIISSDGYVYSYPTLVHIFGYNLKDMPHAFRLLSKRQRMETQIKRAIKKLSFEYASLPLDIDPQLIWGQLGNSYPLQSVILLSKSTKTDIKILEHDNKEEFIKRLTIINRYEMDYFENLLLAYSFIYPNSIMNIDQYWQTCRDILTKTLENTRCLEVEIPKIYTTDTYHKIFELLKSSYLEHNK